MKFQLIAFIFLLSSCANIGTLGGGPSDEKSPVLVRTNISKTNFISKTIELEFDEFVSLNSPEKNIKIYPMHTTLSFSISKKKVIIRFDSLLFSNTTYNLIIDKGIQDINANNPFNYNSVFSTGDFIDSGRILVKIPTYKDYKNLKICLSDMSGADSFKNFNSDYIQDADKEMIEFNGLGKLSYNICLFTDENNDKKPDWYKPAAFIYNARVDSSYQMFASDWIKPFKISKHQYDGSIHKIFYTRLYNYADVLSERSGIVNSDLIYYTADSAVFKGDYQIVSAQNDTVKTIPYKTEMHQIIQSSIKLVRSRDALLLSYLLPQYYGDSEKLRPLTKVSKTLKIKTDSSFTLIDRNGNKDSFIIDKNIMQDIVKLSYFSINISDSLKNSFDLKIIKDNKEILFLSGINSYDEYLEPGVYKIEISKKNSKYSFDPFSLQIRDVVLYEKTLYLKASWEEILEVKL